MTTRYKRPTIAYIGKRRETLSGRCVKAIAKGKKGDIDCTKVNCPALLHKA